MQKSSGAILSLVLVSLVFGAAPAFAQGSYTQGASFGWLNVYVGGQLTKHEKTTTLTFDKYEETATIKTTHPVGSGPVFDISGVYDLAFHNLAVGIGVAIFKNTGKATVDMSIPDPLIFNQHKNTTTTINLKQQETNIYIPIVYTYKMTDKIVLSAFGGPAFIRVRRDAVTSATVTAGTSDATVTTSKEKFSGTGGIVGFDTSYAVTSRMHAVGFLRFTAANPKLKSGLVNRVGGLQVGAGVRIMY